MKNFIDIVSKDKVSGFEASARNSIANRKQLDEEFELKLKKLTEEKIMKKQTAVQWLIQKLTNRQNGVFDGLPHLSLDEIYNQALEMEKQDKEKCFVEGLDYGIKRMKGKTTVSITEAFEKYYKETYEQKEE